MCPPIGVNTMQGVLLKEGRDGEVGEHLWPQGVSHLPVGVHMAAGPLPVAVCLAGCHEAAGAVGGFACPSIGMSTAESHLKGQGLRSHSSCGCASCPAPGASGGRVCVLRPLVVGEPLPQEAGGGGPWACEQQGQGGRVPHQPPSHRNQQVAAQSRAEAR